MKRFTGVFVLWVAFLVTGCSGMDVRRDFDPEVDFTRMKTYDWLVDEDTLESSDPAIQARQRFVEQTVKGAVDRELAAKGIKKDSGKPDFLIAYQTASREKLELQGSKEKGLTFYDRLRYPGWMEGNIEVHYEVGTLILDVMDPKNKELIWRGSAEASILKTTPPEKLEKIINEAVDKMLEEFPPKPAS